MVIKVGAVFIWLSLVPFVICVFAHLVPSPPRPTLTTPFVLAPDTTIFVISLNSSVVVTFWPLPPAPVIVTGLESSLTVPLEEFLIF